VPAILQTDCRRCYKVQRDAGIPAQRLGGYQYAVYECDCFLSCADVVCYTSEERNVYHILAAARIERVVTSHSTFRSCTCRLDISTLRDRAVLGMSRS